jgi:DNA-3-methyladenine glycosylase
VSASPITREWLAVDAETCADRLIGATLVRTLPGGARLSGIIVETEAYCGAEDRAAHTFGGRRTPRNESMYQRAGTAYVYFTYGMHFCMNVVCGEEGEGVAALIRALEPVEGVDTMRAYRAGKRPADSLRDRDLCSGPAKLCAAMGIDRAQNGADLLTPDSPLTLEFDEQVTQRVRSGGVIRTPRIGIASAGEPWVSAPLRFIAAGNPFLSRPGPVRPEEPPVVNPKPATRR